MTFCFPVKNDSNKEQTILILDKKDKAGHWICLIFIEILYKILVNKINTAYRFLRQAVFVFWIKISLLVGLSKIRPRGGFSTSCILSVILF